MQLHLYLLQHLHHLLLLAILYLLFLQTAVQFLTSRWECGNMLSRNPRTRNSETLALKPSLSSLQHYDTQ